MVDGYCLSIGFTGIGSCRSSRLPSHSSTHGGIIDGLASSANPASNHQSQLLPIGRAFFQPPSKKDVFFSSATCWALPSAVFPWLLAFFVGLACPTVELEASFVPVCQSPKSHESCEFVTKTRITERCWCFRCQDPRILTRPSLHDAVLTVLSTCYSFRHLLGSSHQDLVSPVCLSTLPPTACCHVVVFVSRLSVLCLSMCLHICQV